jgi:hypothetical protein
MASMTVEDIFKASQDPALRQQARQRLSAFADLTGQSKKKVIGQAKRKLKQVTTPVRQQRKKAKQKRDTRQGQRQKVQDILTEMENLSFDPSSVQLTAADEEQLRRINRAAAERSAASGQFASGFGQRNLADIQNISRSQAQLNRFLPQFQAKQQALGSALDVALLPIQQRQRMQALQRQGQIQSQLTQQQANIMAKQKELSPFEKALAGISAGTDILGAASQAITGFRSQ